tara:strand:- start:41 stop:307 length:267 start_codon:yes stop_codon:yes gene_type:complete
MLRIQAGDYVKQLRIMQSMTQRELAEILELRHYTFISQLETGQGRLPPALTIKTAIALKQDVREFALKMLSFYDPHTHQALTYSRLEA